MKSALASGLARLRLPRAGGRVRGGVLIFSGLFLLSVLVTLVVLLSGRESFEPAPEVEDAPVSSAQQLIEDFAEGGAGALASGDDLTAQDFVLPRSVRDDRTDPYLLRPPLKRWSEAQVKRYWIPLDEIALDLIRRENDGRIEELFEGIP